MSRRNSTIDTAKGIGILAVSIYHLVYRPEGGIADQILCECIWLFIPLFFLSSGYSSNDRGTFRKNIIHRFKVLMLPALKYTAMLLLLGGAYCVMFHGYTARDWLRDAIYTYLRPEFSSRLFPEWGAGGILFENLSPVWFVWSMMFSCVVFYALSGYTKSLAGFVLSCTALLSAGIILYGFNSRLSWGLTVVPVYAAVMLCGAYLSRHSVRVGTNIFAGLAALAVHVMMFRLWGTDYLYASVLGTIGSLSVIPFFIQTFIGGYAVIVLCRVIERSKRLSKIFTFVGKNTFSFLMLHGIFGMLFSDLLHTYIKLSPDHWYVAPVTPEIFIKSLIVWAISVICCVIFCMLKRKEIQ